MLNPWLKSKSWVRDVNGWYWSAKALRLLGADRGATRLLERALQAQPKRAELHLEAVRFYLKIGQLEKAAWHGRYFNTVTDGEDFLFWLERTCDEDTETILGNRLNVLTVLGNWCLQIGDYDKAIGFFKRVLAGDRADPAVLNNIGLCLLRFGKEEEALARFQEAAALKSGPEICANKGLALNRLNRWQEALDCYEWAQQQGYSNQELLNNKGYALFHLKRYEEAVLCYEMARMLTPKDIVILNNLAACYQKLNRFESAAECFQAALGSSPRDSALHNNYALYLYREKRYAEALSHYERALELEQTNNTFLANKVQCLAHLGRYQEALLICDQLLQSAPENRTYWGLKADVLTVSGAREEAIDHYNHALGLTG